MKKLYFLVVIQFSISIFGKTQNSPNFLDLERKAILLCNLGNSKAALTLFDPIEELMKTMDQDQKLDFFLVKYGAIKCFLSEKITSDYDKHLVEIIKNIEAIRGRSDTVLIEMYNSLGVSLYESVNYQDAERAFEKALQIYSNNPKFDNLRLIANNYYDLSKTLLRKGDILNAVTYGYKGLAFVRDNFEENDPITGKLLENLGYCHDKLNSFEKSKFYYEKALKIYRDSYGENNSNTSRLYDKIGRLHLSFDQYENAIDYFRKGLQIRKRVLKPTSFEIGSSYDNIGNSYYYLQDYEKAIFFFEKALKAFNNSASKTTVADQYSKIAACYTNLKKFKLAEKHMEQCFGALEFDSKLKYPFEKHKTSHIHLLITLYFKAKNHQKAYEAGWGTSQLHEASYWFDLCIELIEYINSTFTEPGSKQYLLERFYYIFEAAINCKYHLYQESDSLLYLEQAFGYAERSKALLLKEAMQMAGAVLASAIPESLQEEENRLKKAIIERENRRYELQQGGEGGPEVHELNSEIFNLKQAYHQVMDSIRRQHPKEHRLRYPAAPLTPREIQEGLLAPGQALLQYFLGDDHLFLFVIRQGDVSIIKKPKEKGLAEAVLGFRESIYGWSLSQEDSLAEQYADYGYQLYQSLVQPVAHLLPERLIIVPDGILEYVPFEALLREAAGPAFRNFSSYPYLIRDFQIGYAHSARLLQEMKTAAYTARRPWVLAFAPSFSDPPGQDASLASRRRNLGRLTGNVKEVQAIKRLLRTRIYQGTDATRERFLADAPYYSIIHLATHAKANDQEGEYSYLAFAEVPDTLQNELLYAKDLYSLRLQADLVVISACESGVGELRRGEGVISIARGFSYAGAKSLATTLWRVSDRESAALMASFYQQLKDGRPKDEALRAAKLQFISQPGAMYAHPFFWAAFTLTGDMAPIAVSGQIFPAWVYALLIGLFVFLSLRFAKRKPS